MGYIVAFVLGIFVATVGIQGVASMADKVVNKTQEVMIQSVK